jgi:hypothetical protein
LTSFKKRDRGGITDDKKRITRRKKRERLEECQSLSELVKIIKHFFPELLSLLRQVSDSRHPSYISYSNQIILFVRILAVVFHIGSMRKITSSFNNSNAINNIAVLLGEQALQELPHFDTINNYLKSFKAEDLEKVITSLVKRLIRMQSFYGSRIRDKYWQIIIDGTEIHNFGKLEKEHCPHCLKREHNKNKEGKEEWREYYHSALEAKLVLCGSIVISIATEFIENEEADVSKQDCEINAFKRLSSKLKKRFERLPICLGMDSLYACAPVFDLCRKNNWHYIIRFKYGSIKTVAEDFHALKTVESSQIIEVTDHDTGVKESYRYVTGIEYHSHSLNVVEYIKSDLPYPFVFITDLSISARNCEQLVRDGRRRWKIENEGFNAQKNEGYELGHLFCRDSTAMKNHYLCIQIGHMIYQLYVNAPDIFRELKLPLYAILENLVRSFQSVRLSCVDVQLIGLKERFRFP